LSKPRDLSKLFSTSTSIATDVELISTVNSASAYALSEANDYTDNELSSIDLTFTINTASAAAFASASAYTDSAIASFEALPSQDGNAGKYLSTSGSVTSWQALDLNAAIVSASTAAYSSASAYTNSQISNIDLSATIQTASAAAVTYLVDSAPGTLDTLNELSAALNDDPNFYSTIQAVYLTQSNASATYATISDANTSISRWSKIYSASATVISGVDDNANNLDYTLGYATLFINGILQDPTNYTASSGSTIVLNDAVLINDVVEVLSYKTFNVANTYTTSEIDSKVSNYTRWVKTLSGSATVISGVDDNSLPLLYTIGNEEVYVNGILLKEVTDYATTSASVITLTEAALENDTVEIINFTTINLASVYTKTESDNKFLTQSSASSTYLTQSNGITAATASATYTPLSSPVTSFKNKIINSEFDIWQRGTTFSTSNAYTADRWVIVGASGQTVSVSQQSFTPGAAPVSGYEGTFFARLAWSGTPSGTYWFTQRIEDVRTLAGQTVTLSFWAKASSTTSAFTPMFEQNFGSGGSSVVGTTGSAITLTTSWQRFTQTFLIPSISGKTIGTSSYLEVRPLAGSTAVTGNNIDIWGVQVERGSIATEFEQRFIGTELQMCQRYYQEFKQFNGIKYPSSYVRFNINLPVQMRGTMTVYYKDMSNNLNKISTYNAADGKTDNRNAIAVTGDTNIVTILPLNTDSDPGYAIQIATESEL
jgi:hypothetical protein